MALIAWFKDINKDSTSLVGGKGANLGEMWNAKFPIPPGFVVTAEAYKEFVIGTGIQPKILEIVEKLDVDNNEELQKASKGIQKIILEAEMPADIKQEIVTSYDSLNINQEIIKNATKTALSFLKAGRDLPFVAVRSSATAEDLPEASFAGQQATFLNVKGPEKVVKAVQDCWASLFTARAIYYRKKNNFPTDKVYIAVVVQKMVNSEKAGVMFTINPPTNNQDEIVIEGAYGLGEAVVSGEVNPDEYTVDKNTVKIKDKKLKKQDWGYFRSESGNNYKKDFNGDKAGQQKLTDDEILKLAKHGIEIEKHYEKPMDIEWAIDGPKMYIVQARPVTTIKKVREKIEPASEDVSKAEAILTGLAASPGIGFGKVKIVHNLDELGKVQPGDILVTKMTSPDMVPAMERAVAIVTDEGGVTSHAAIVSREMGTPCVVGTEKATGLLKDNDEITVDGGKGVVYRGILKISQPKETAHEQAISHAGYEELVTATKIYMNLGEPEKIESYKDLPFDGIGLMRIEFIITDYVKAHPLFLIKQGKSDEYVNKLAEGVGTVARAISPKPLIVRFSDFKTNEYSNLEGGKEFEPHEDNPMIGWRGVSRYISDDFNPAFRLECNAIKKLRDEGLKNVHVMLPFVRTTWEVARCLDILKSEGLVRNFDFKIWLMAETPAIALTPEEFAKLDIDGASIGSNDLTQGVLCIDRDSSKLGKMGYFDERNTAVLTAIKRIIHGFKLHGKTVSICGQAPSEYPEIVEFLVKNGITSISVNPDVVVKTREIVASVERKIILEKVESLK